MASSSAPVTGSLSFPAGNTEVVQIAYTAADGSNTDITGYSATWSFGPYNADGTRGSVAVTKSTGAGTLQIVVSGGASLITFTLQPTDTNGLAPGAYWTSLQVFNPGGAYDGGYDDSLILTAAPGAAPGAVVAPSTNSFFGSAFSLTTDTDFLTTDGGIVKTLGYDFGDLQAQVLDYLDRPELANMFPIWVRLFQNKLNRVLRTGMQEAVITLNPSPITGGCQLPNDYAAYRAVQYGTGPTWNLQYATPEVIANEWPYPSGGIPRLFTIKGMMLFPVPANAVTLTYYRGVQPYLSGVLNDWVLLYHFDAYLYGTLCEAQLYLKNEDSAASWNARAAAAIQDIIAADRDQRWGASREMSLEATP